MTIKEYVHDLTRNHNWSDFDFSNEEHASLEKLVIMAYYIGQEEAIRDVSTSYNNLIAEQRQRANNCRYNKMANEVVGDKDFLYHSGFRGDMTTTFGNDRV